MSDKACIDQAVDTVDPPNRVLLLCSYDPILPVAADIAREVSLLCFDEFQVGPSSALRAPVMHALYGSRSWLSSR